MYIKILPPLSTNSSLPNTHLHLFYLPNSFSPTSDAWSIGSVLPPASPIKTFTTFSLHHCQLDFESLDWQKMGYKMVMYVDGGCRGNGQPGAFGACACFVVKKWGRSETWTERLPASSFPVPTSQRAELCAIIIALKHAIKERQNLDNNPWMDVTIHTDSRYAHGCMTEWYSKWQNNGFINSLGNEVANRDLIERALELESDILDHGKVRWEWIPRSDNTAADEAANEEMDDMEEDYY